MNDTQCHANNHDGKAAPADARELLQKVLGIKRVASWCGVDQDTPYQWLTRGTVENPIPPTYVPAIVVGARADNIHFDVGLLWPAMRGLL